MVSPKPCPGQCSENSSVLSIEYPLSGGLTGGASIPITTATKKRWHIHGREGISWGRLHGEAFFKAFDATFGLKPLEVK